MKSFRTKSAMARRVWGSYPAYPFLPWQEKWSVSKGSESLQEGAERQVGFSMGPGRQG